MRPGNIDAVNKSFEIQAKNFESKALQFSKEEYLSYTIKTVNPGRSDSVLEVAAGTCVCGRSFSPYVQSVTCIDATEAMLNVGKEEAARLSLGNMTFIKGYAEDLPFPCDSFDIVFSRLAFHHFTDTDRAFSEMARCLRPGGKLVMIDMEAVDEDLRHAQDEIETLRDPSHVRNLSKAEMHALFSSYHVEIKTSETKRIQQNLESWMALTATSEKARTEIIQRMRADLDGKAETGFMPHVENNEIFFDQRWILTLGIKGNAGDL